MPKQIVADQNIVLLETHPTPLLFGEEYVALMQVKNSFVIAFSSPAITWSRGIAYSKQNCECSLW